MAVFSNLDRLMGIKRLNVRECIGIYISLNGVYVAQVLEKSGGIEVDTLIKLPVGQIDSAILRPSELNEGFFTSPAYWLEPIKKIIDSKKWNTKNVVISFSHEFVIFRHFVMQDVPRKYWKKTVPLQARKYIHYPFDNGVYDYSVYQFTAGLTKMKKLGIIFSIAPARIVSIIESGMKKIGLNVVSVEASPLSIYRLFNQADKEVAVDKGTIYANFTGSYGQFLFVINNTPVLLREVEIQRIIGNRSRLEVNNCIDFISKQLEKNPFEDIVFVSDDTEFWTPILESEVKCPIRKWKISDIFGFSVEGFAEMAAVGACLKFVNNKVADIDLYRKNRSTEEEIRGILTIWKLAVIVIALILCWSIYTNISAFITKSKFESKQVAQREMIEDFENLSASAIEEKVKTMSSNASLLENMLSPVSYTKKLEVLPTLLPDEMWITKLSISYPYTMKTFKEKNSLVLEGYSSSLEDKVKELEFGKIFTQNMDTSPVMADICGGQASIDYVYDENTAKSARNKTVVLGTRFILKCERNAK
ncbi:MAG: hypothetical protein LBG46_06440 [Elusimicrobiota bacterium]|jgi:hypothetical protein|nr:hypothetical protein [Elusimicrobiota bacterium]